MKVKENTPLFYRTAALVKAVPAGRVVTYGQVAQLISAPGCARHVSFILSSSSKKHRLPWQRVVNSSGGVSDHRWAMKQIRLLKSEGVVVEGRRVNLSRFAWTPKASELRKILKGLPKHIPLSER
ncbi:MAG: MGMT family protein [Bdellovibrionales bacterium]|nr:MGMT family protein [Bdellovibrionales bacterium]